jgi:hypothetical protein
MLQHIVELPFWISILVAAFFYLVFRFVPSVLAGNSISGKALATVFPTIAPWAAIAIPAAGLIGVVKRQWKRLLLSRATGVRALRQMGWPDFELLVGEAFRQQGYIGEATRRSSGRWWYRPGACPRDGAGDCCNASTASIARSRSSASESCLGL